jgi:hypothetical protein
MKMHKSKTMWFAFALAILGSLMELFPYLRDLIDPKYYSVSFIVIGLVVAALRFVTTQPIQK